MKQQSFEQHYAAKWLEFQQILKELRNKNQAQPISLRDFPARYRQICNLYALAKSRRYSPHLVQMLHDLVMESHQYFYRSSKVYSWLVVRFYLQEFPAALRKQIKLFWLSTLFLIIPGIAVGVLCYKDENFVYSVMPAFSVMEMESMYDPQNKVIGQARESSTNIAMFGYYIRNNVSIGFQAFAGGLLLGVGSIFILILNGILIGAVAGHLTLIGYTSTFWPFVSGHSAFELTAICITGAAGLRLGLGLIAPGRYQRGEALKIASKEALPLVLGAASMLFIAAIIEAFWSSNTLFPAPIKYTVAAVMWTAVISYFVLLGRRHADH